MSIHVYMDACTYVDRWKQVSSVIKAKTDHKDNRDILGSVLNKSILKNMAFD